MQNNGVAPNLAKLLVLVYNYKDFIFPDSARMEKSSKKASTPKGKTKNSESKSPPSSTSRPAEASVSDKWRQEGNDHYKKAFSEGLSPVLKKSRVQDALNCYNKALATSGGEYESLASAAKNYAKAAWLQATVVQDYDKDIKLFTFYYKDAITHFGKALQAGNRGKDLSWIQDLQTSYRSCLDNAFKSCRGTTYRNRLSCIDSFLQSMVDETYQGDCYEEMTQVLFHQAVTALENGDFKTCLWALKECYRPIEEMKMRGRERPDLAREANVMEADVLLQTAAAESHQAINTGMNDM